MVVLRVTNPEIIPNAACRLLIVAFRVFIVSKVVIIIFLLILMLTHVLSLNVKYTHSRMFHVPCST